MARIRDIRLIPLEYTMDPIKAYGMSRSLIAARAACLVELTTDDGVVGIGEAWGPAKATAGYLEIIKGAFVGREIYDREAILSDILCRRYHLGWQNQMIACVSGINIAIYDAMGKTLGLPVCKLLGGRIRDRIPAYASDGYLSHDPDNQLDAQLERIADQGFPGAKFKIGLGPKSDAERVALARRILGDDMLLLVDTNGNYTVDVALDSMRRIAPYDVHFYEEPLPPQDFEGYRILTARAPIPVATGEALYTIYDFTRMIAPRAVDVAQPDPTLCGGLDQAKAVALLCQAHNVRYSPHVWGSAVSVAAAVHLLASLPDYPHSDNAPYPRLLEYDVGVNPLRDELLTEPLRAIEGHVPVPDKPGLGIELDPDAVRRYRID
jgi:D-galactarolactone cycloisomerase